MDGLELLDRAHKLQPRMPVVLMTAYASVESAVRGVRADFPASEVEWLPPVSARVRSLAALQPARVAKAAAPDGRSAARCTRRSGLALGGRIEGKSSRSIWNAIESW